MIQIPQTQNWQSHSLTDNRPPMRFFTKLRFLQEMTQAAGDSPSKERATNIETLFNNTKVELETTIGMFGDILQSKVFFVIRSNPQYLRRKPHLGLFSS